MKSRIKYIYIIIATVVGISFFGFSSHPDPNPEENAKDKLLIEILKEFLNRGHYKPQDINDSFSEAIFNNYIDAVDPYKRYFLSTDIAYFKKYYHDIDNQFIRSKLDFFDLVSTTYIKRMKSIEKQYPSFLQIPFNYKSNETINLNPDEIDYAKTEKEQTANWKKYAKFTTLSRVDLLLKEQKLKIEEDSSYIKKSFKTLEKEARKKSEKSFGDLFYYENKSTREERFSVFLNTITSEFDPHTTYFAPSEEKRFEAGMAGSIEGIGARLTDERGYTKIVELVIGGPAYKQGDLEKGDIILKVAQKDKEAKDIVGMKLSDAIELIKGKKGTTVELTVKKVDNTIQKIDIIRDIVEFEETFAKSSITIKDGKKYGIVHLPKFYVDITGKTDRNAASDMAKEIERLKLQDNIKGLIIDLRGNGGGSLSTAIDIGGLFIDKGPIVQVKDKVNKPLVKSDRDGGQTLWNGPVVILVNEFSASASEILAAALQDYKRAVVMGSKQTYGKGTVQSVIEINRHINYNKNLGALKLTIQKFYRINGGATQIKGVASDIITPTRYQYLEILEKDNKTSLPWDNIKKAKYNTTNSYSNYDEVIKNSQERIDSNNTFKAIHSYAKWIKDNQDNQSYPLNFEAYQAEEVENTKVAEKYKEELDYTSDYEYIAPVYDQQLFVTDTILKEKRENWYKKLKEDVYMNEAIETLSELQLAK